MTFNLNHTHTGEVKIVVSDDIKNGFKIATVLGVILIGIKIYSLFR